MIVETKLGATSIGLFLAMYMPRNYKNTKSVKIFPCLISAPSSSYMIRACGVADWAYK
jgi:hypothetical protein